MRDQIGLNKEHKESALLDAAYELFTSKDFNSTAIDEIVHRAGVAKGTFYLYFRDKYDLLDRIVLRKTSALLSAAILEAKGRQFAGGTEKMLFFVNYIIEFLNENRLLLKIIYKNLSFSLYRRALDDPQRGGELRTIVDEFKKNIMGSDFKEEDTGTLLFILLELTGSVCYSAIICSEPAPIEEIKPMLFKVIGKILA
ncbi:MAG: TetR/AcrR family transcriptional regulator [Clostridia bacterium]|nr:TetR/AcrR family transcriptional regulator [Clostridia bacterium]